MLKILSKQTKTEIQLRYLLLIPATGLFKSDHIFIFFEVNRQLSFDRVAAYGMRLNIPSGTAVRFEPGEEKQVSLVNLGGHKIAYGFNGLVNGSTESVDLKKKGLEKSGEQGFKNMAP